MEIKKFLVEPVKVLWVGEDTDAMLIRPTAGTELGQTVNTLDGSQLQNQTQNGLDKREHLAKSSIRNVGETSPTCCWGVGGGAK